jgi:hypothetical protein
MVKPVSASFSGCSVSQPVRAETVTGLVSLGGALAVQMSVLAAVVGTSG